jgi:predicted RNase H-like HicB family nuclease
LKATDFYTHYSKPAFVISLGPTIPPKASLAALFTGCFPLSKTWLFWAIPYSSCNVWISARFRAKKYTSCYNIPMNRTLTYSLLIEAPPDEGGYLAYFPALPGCNTWGATYEETVKNAEEALVGYLETLQMNGQPLPREIQPSSDVSLGLMVSIAALV